MDPNKPCVFPFKYLGINYTECSDVIRIDDGNEERVRYKKLHQNIIDKIK